MASPLPYTLGTVTLEHGSADIVGTGTGWAINGVRGGLMTVEVAGANTLVVDTVTDDTHATAATKWMGPSGTYAYAISMASADAADTIWASRHWSRVVGQALLAGIVPVASGTLAERDALDPQPANGEWFAHAEPPADLTFYRKVPAGWEGPYQFRGPGGAPAPLASLTDLSDVTLASPADGKVLRYQDGQWRDAVLAAGDIGGVATARLIGRATAGAGAAEQLTVAAARTLLAVDQTDNTADLDKPVSTAQAARIDNAAVLAPIANRLVPAEPAAAAFDLPALAGLIRDEEDRAKSWAGDVNDKLVYASPSTKWVFNRARVLVSGTALRCDHDPATGESLGVRVEPQATNRVHNSRDLSGSGWTWVAASGGPSATVGDPSVYGGDLWSIDPGTNNGYRRQTIGSITPPINTATVSYSAKRGNQPFSGGLWNWSQGTPSSSIIRILYNHDTDDLQIITEGTAPTIISSGRKLLANGEVRITVSATTTNNAPTHILDLHRKGTQFFSAGETAQYGNVQVTALPYETSYIPTTGSFVTRAADDITLPIADIPWAGGSGTLTLNGSAVTPILNGASDALDIAAMVAAAGATHLKTLTWVPS